MISITAIFVFFSCSSTPVTLAQNCDVRLESLSPTSASEGDVVRAIGGPMTSVWDTAVYVSSTRAEVVSLQREGCEACDECKEENNCKACDDCDSCDAECDAECTESIDFIAPSLSTSTAQVSFYNGHGQSNAISLMFDGNRDTGDSSDSGETTLPVDTGSSEDTSSIR